MTSKTLTLCLSLCISTSAWAETLGRTLFVGPDRDIASIAAAAKLAQEGDTILIDPGEYIECARWHADRLTIMGRGDADHPVVIRDKSCNGKAIFVIAGDDIRIENIRFIGATVPDRNGAGIRFEGRNLTLKLNHFIDNEMGVLANADEASHIQVINCVFENNGTKVGRIGHSLYVGRVDRLTVSYSTFKANRIGHYIKSRAKYTVVEHSHISDGANGTASYLIEAPNGGSLILRNNYLEKGPHSDNPENAIAIAFEGEKNPQGEILIESNAFIHNGQAGSVIFVNNRSATTAVLRNNTLDLGVTALKGPGIVVSADQR